MGRRTTAALAAITALLASSAVALAAVVPGKGDHEGHTSQGKCDTGKCRMYVFVNDAHRIKEFGLEWHTKCNSGKPYSATDIDKDRKGHRITQSGGKFSGSAKDDFGLGNGYKGHSTITYGGTFSTPTKGTGTFTAKVKITKNGNKVDQCNKTVDWHVPRTPAAAAGRALR
ncbi:MAG TPA: hypothetical protein VJT75_03375 [Thermoleophilaceae bacterium]|nr:hypothetical protein [Thermoleophilaceae bacterium]